MSGTWPWLFVAGLGCFHGINPAMGWLFAVALGLHRRSGRVVLVSLVPIALGHAAAIALVIVGVFALGLVIDRVWLGRVAGALLLAWAAWHALYGHRRRVRVGMQTGLWGLALWSFLMANAHGAGLMLIPALGPLCLSSVHPGAESEVAMGAAALAVHTAAMLGTVAVVAGLVYRRVGVAFLRTAWINLDLIWVLGLGVCGALLLFLPF